MPTFEWISWEAAATLITGILAVGAAIYVGSRQAGIAKTQAVIQRDQTDIQTEILRLESLKFKADLYDRRLTIFNACRTFASSMVKTGNVPGFHENAEGSVVGWEEHVAFVQARGAAKFLASGSAQHAMETIWDMSADLLTINAEIDDSQEANTDALGKIRRRKMDHRMAIQAVIESLPESFSEDLKLTLPERPRPQSTEPPSPTQ